MQPICLAGSPAGLCAAGSTFTWMGLYIGVNAGGAFRVHNFDDNLFIGSLLFLLANNSIRNHARFIGGAQAGVNWQINQSCWASRATAMPTQQITATTSSASATTATPDPGTVRGRAGIAFDRFLSMAQAVFAFGRHWSEDRQL